MAARLAEELAGVDGVQLLRQPDGNQMFLTMDPGLAGRLRDAGAEFDDWPEVGPNVVRLVTAFNMKTSRRFAWPQRAEEHSLTNG